eukprot:1178790-Prorocentrum_minimum.AAC.2
MSEGWSGQRGRMVRGLVGWSEGRLVSLTRRLALENRGDPRLFVPTVCSERLRMMRRAGVRRRRGLGSARLRGGEWSRRGAVLGGGAERREGNTNHQI